MRALRARFYLIRSQRNLGVRKPPTLMAVKTILIPLLLAAGSLRGQAPAVYLPLRPLRADSVTRFAVSHPIARVAASDARVHHIRVGAVVGAVIGATVGIVAGANVPVGCEVGNCREPRHARLTAIVGLGSMGAVAGGVLGALIGAVVPTATPPRSAGSNRPAS